MRRANTAAGVYPLRCLYLRGICYVGCMQISLKCVVIEVWVMFLGLREGSDGLPNPRMDLPQECEDLDR